MDEDRINKQYFIDTDGKCYKYDGDDEEIVSIHYEIAHRLFPNAKSPDDVLMNLGWVMVGSSCYHTPIIHKKPTQAQINKLYELNLYYRLCRLYKDSYPNYVKYGDLWSD